MKRFAFIIIFFGYVFCLTAQETEINGCRITSYYGNETFEFIAYGNVYVETNPKERVNLYVKVVNDSIKSTYKVFKTTDTPKKCGEWRFVTDRSKAKFTIRYVKDWEECSIYFTTNRNTSGWF